MTLEMILSLIAFGFITIGFVFYLIAMLMERYYDRKISELDNKLKQDAQWRKEYRK